jgi:hypothetical protein
MSLPAAGIAEAAAAFPPSEIEALGLQLERLTRRSSRLYKRVLQCSDECARLCRERAVGAFLPNGRRNVEYDNIHRDMGYDTAWKRWSVAVSAALDIAKAIRGTPTVSVADLSVKHRALLFELFHDRMADAADPEHLRLLRGFGRELRRVTHGIGAKWR